MKGEYFKLAIDNRLEVNKVKQLQSQADEERLKVLKDLKDLKELQKAREEIRRRKLGLKRDHEHK